MTQEIAVTHDGQIYRCYQAASLRERLEVCRYIVRGLGSVTLSRKDGRVVFIEPHEDNVRELLTAIGDRLYECWRLVLS